MNLNPSNPNYFTSLMTSQDLESPNNQPHTNPYPTERYKNEWLKEEDLVLAKGWLHVSEDRNTGKSQREKDFWRRIHEYYESNNTSGITRTLTKVKGHWHYMNPLVVAFNNQYLVLKSQKLSGWSEEDFKSDTQDKYKAIYGSSFKHEHVWNLVKHEPKWILGNTTSETSRVSCDSQTPVNLDDIEDIVRPTGTKKAKTRSKRKIYCFLFIFKKRT
ncbi:homeodomain-like, No apical meristem-associated domain protein [Artemisia annua]|uniref:Homeodomain-like, No apical meristem-associated domain protein n=1 Tax=Artemisia annua TaxID=35608 RepID=A0A2U1LAZ7_ARTAN|nr:homeodomain-like, No apical meristem-associated domain protein [Artemisia annua]